MALLEAGAPQMAPFFLDDYDSLRLFDNPGSKRALAGTIQPVIDRLIEVGLQSRLDVGQQPTQPGVEAMMRVLETTRPDDLLAVVSGDGGTSNFLRAVMALGLENPVILVGGGDANDQAHNVHTKKNIRKPFRILNDPQAKIGQLHPLSVGISRPELAETHLMSAFGYFGIGLTSLVGNEFNKKTFRDEVKDMSEWRRVLKEFGIVREKIVDAPVLTVIPDGEDPDVLETLEYNFPNGPWEAKFFHFPGMEALEPDAAVLGMPVDSQEPSKFERSYSVFVRGIGRATILGDLKHFGMDEEQYFSVMSSNGEVPIQIDGEASRYPSETHFSVGISQQFVNIVTTQKHAA